MFICKCGKGTTYYGTRLLTKCLHYITTDKWVYIMVTVMVRLGYPKLTINIYNFLSWIVLVLQRALHEQIEEDGRFKVW